ncbi:MAG TPA: hypothetical protein VFW07_05100 [Parafilimonas sp.]|nr:hypothetical protein [Parafilimonas sp.]
MCKKICGKPSAKLAIELINQKKIKILFPEDIIDFEQKNFGKSKEKYSAILNNYSGDIENANKEDMELYRFLKERGSDINYFKEIILNNCDSEIPQLGKIKIRIIQEIFQRMFYYLSKKKSERLRRGF